MLCKGSLAYDDNSVVSVYVVDGVTQISPGQNRITVNAIGEPADK
jgi:hypothetical protein